MPSVLQSWVESLSLMQQSVLLSAIRGPDGVRKRHECKGLIRWYRRCVLLSAFDGKALTTPVALGGGSFTGPSIDDNSIPPYSTAPWHERMKPVVDAFLDARDELPAHYYGHFMHAAQILGYKHPDGSIRSFWNDVYVRMVHALHVWPETEEQMDRRLGDHEGQWRERNDPSSTCSD